MDGMFRSRGEARGQQQRPRAMHFPAGDSNGWPIRVGRPAG